MADQVGPALCLHKPLLEVKKIPGSYPRANRLTFHVRAVCALCGFAGEWFDEGDEHHEPRPKTNRQALSNFYKHANAARDALLGSEPD